MICKTQVWFLDLSNVVALATSRFVGWKTKTPRADTAPLVLTWNVMISIPSFMLKILYNTHFESSGLLARHITEDCFTTVKVWLDAIKECVSDVKIQGIAAGAGYVCLGLKMLLKFVDFYLAADPTLLQQGLLMLVQIDDSTKLGSKPVERLDDLKIVLVVEEAVTTKTFNDDKSSSAARG